MGRIIIFTGKGGVGKSSMASAHALKAAREGKRTLIVSTDMAHNLGDLFEQPVGKEIVSIETNLDGLEIDPDFEMNHEFSHMLQAIYDMMPGFDEEMDQMAMIPGVEELFSLLKVQQIYESGKYDLIIVDCAPTGETLSLLKFPELLSWYMEKFFPLGKLAMKVMRPISKPLLKVKLPDGKAMEDIEELYLKLGSLNQLLKNQEISSIRLVSVPEKMVVDETKRNYMYLNLYHFNMDGLYINRILPKEADSAFFSQWHCLQEHYVQELEQAFGAVPVYKIPWFEVEVKGKEALEMIDRRVLEGKNVFDVCRKVVNEEYRKTQEGYELRLYLPFVSKEEIELCEGKMELIVKIGNYKRDIPLPSTLSSYRVTGAKMEDSVLRIHFKKEDHHE